jgi:hypothetical protein
VLAHHGLERQLQAGPVATGVPVKEPGGGGAGAAVGCFPENTEKPAERSFSLKLGDVLTCTLEQRFDMVRCWRQPQTNSIAAVITVGDGRDGASPDAAAWLVGRIRQRPHFLVSAR